MCMGVSIARTGEMEYAEGETPLDSGDDGKVIITRVPEEVFAPDTIASFEGKAITIMHPTDFVGPENWAQLAKGTITNVRRGEGDQNTDLIADLLITDAVAIALVKKGLREVSCGYEAEYTQTGEGQGVQKNIIGNHLALVEAGRAGSTYAINDHKGKGSKMKLSEKIKAVFAKAQDDAMKMADAEEAPKKEDDKEKAKDDGAGYSMDDVMKAVKDLGGKVDAMAPKQKDAEPPKEEEKSKDADEAVSMEDRMKALEMKVDKLLQSMSSDEFPGNGDKAKDEEGEKAEDAGCEDDDSDMTADSASRVEILAPGMKASGKNFKAKAIEAAYATVDGKSVIEMFTGNKSPDLKNEKFIDTLFIAASEVLKSSRSSELAKTRIRTNDFQSGIEVREGGMTPEKMNEINSKHYAGSR